MSQSVSTDAGGFLMLMTEETRLPANWESCGMWLTHAQLLAQFMADHRGHISIPDAAMLVGLGGVLIHMARLEREATDAAACLIDRAGKGA